MTEDNYPFDVELLKSYLKKICKTSGALNYIPHRKLLAENDEAALTYEKAREFYETSHIQLVFLAKHDFPVLKCQMCGKEFKKFFYYDKPCLENYNQPRRFCNSKCANQHESTQKKIDKTKRKRYGDDYSIVLYKKQEAYFLEKYGVTNPGAVPEVKAKREKTCLERYGMVTGCRTPKANEKRLKTNIEKYGVDHVSKNKTVILKQKATTKENTYDVFKKFISSLNIEMMSSYEEYLKNDIVKYRCNNCGTEYEGVISYSCQNFEKCPECCKIQPNVSSYEHEISNFIKELGFEVELSNTSLISPKELDIYIPEKKIAIEFDGIFWHSSYKLKDPLYHLKKTQACEELGIQLLHIFENEWRDETKQNIVKRIIKSKLGLYNQIIYARKTILKELSIEEYKEFLNQNHIQSYKEASTRLGLFFENELISCIGIESNEIVRFCNKIDFNVVDSVNVFLKDFDELFINVDLRYSNGSEYEACGFEIVEQTEPEYFYVTNNGLELKEIYNHYVLENKLEIFNEELSEQENMEINKIYRIYDCGNLKMKWRNF